VAIQRFLLTVILQNQKGSQRSRRRLDLIDKNGRIREPALSNFDLVKKDLVTLTKNFEWLDWKAFLKKKFLYLKGIRN